MRSHLADRQTFGPFAGFVHDERFVLSVPDGNMEDAGSAIDFPGTKFYAQVGLLGVCRICAGAHQLQYQPDSSANGVAYFLKALLQVSGETRYLQAEGEITLRAGEWLLYDPLKAYALRSDGPVEHLVLVFPRTAIIGKTGLLPAAAAEPFGCRGGMAQIVASMFATLFHCLPTIASDYHSDVSEALLHMIRLALDERLREQSKLSINDTLRDRIKIFVRRHLRDPELSIGKVAEAMKCSKRNVHKIFEGDGETLHSYISRLRLDFCRSDLVDPEQFDRSITDISLSWGFNSSAHFSNVFRGRFGVSPRECRRGARSVA